MSDQAAEGQSEQPNEGGNSGFTPPATQEDLNRIINDRISRERAKYADYKDLQGKAARLDQIEQANKSEVEKAAERIAAAEATVAKVPELVTEQLRSHLAALHKISDEDAELFLTATDPEKLLKQIDRLAGREADRKKQGNYVPREGTTPPAGTSDARETVRELFAG